MKGNIRVRSQMLMHKVVLPARMIQMSSSVFISSILAHHRLQEVHGVKFRVLPGGCIKEHSEIRVIHLVISHEQSRRCEVRLVQVLLLLGTLSQFECLARLRHLSMADITSHCNNRVLGCIVLLNELFDFVLIDLRNVLADAVHGLPHEMVSV
jgi:hypothetical protein